MNRGKIAIAGAGLCGTMMAIRLAEYGYKIDLYERRPDLRKTDISAGRSINLALSDRGLNALDMIGLKEKVSAEIIPMHGRLIHPSQGENTMYAYSGRSGEYINSVSRGGLNMTLLDAAEKSENINIFFEANVRSVDIKNTSLKVLIGDEERSEEYDVIFGSDGAGSAVRRTMQSQSSRLRFDFQQKWLSTGYKELHIPPTENGGWKIEKHALHIWPRKGHMMIALPNLDGSFTLTMFTPFEGPIGMDRLVSDELITEFMEENFGDATIHIPDLLTQFHANPTASLGTIKCYPWKYNRTVLLGDSAHAIVPFYGQGMNCALEDCVVLDKLIQMHDHDWDQILSDYQEQRKKDADAIADLAEDNFYEMRDATADPVFNKKRIIELRLEESHDYYSKYSLVTFRSDVPYHIAMKQGRLQNKILYDIAKEIDNPSDVPLAPILEKVNAYVADRM